MRDILIETSLKDRRNPNDPIRSILIDPDGESLTPLEEIKDASDRRRMEHILNSKFGSPYFRYFLNPFTLNLVTFAQILY